MTFRVACMDSSIRYKFVGMGKRTELFLKEMGNMPENVKVIPFLQKSDLEEEYRRCSLLLLPTRQECWGLVVNEAASFGTPIVSTWAVVLLWSSLAMAILSSWLSLEMRILCLSV